jgi:cation:H+ antiporter
MWIVILQFLISGAVIVVGGIGLARSADAIARVTGLGQMLAGALLVATATSLPDLVVGISSARNGWVNLIVGDLLGAALINLLILALLDLSHFSRGRMLSRMGAAHALSGTMSMTLLAIVGISVFIPDRFDVTFCGVGIGLWVVAGAYFLGLRLVFFDLRYAAKQVEKNVTLSSAGKGALRPIIGYAISAGLIMIAGPQLAHASDRLAELTGLGNTFFGTAFLPLCTTLPELVAGITAIRMRAFPLVVGNAFGSIAFNLLLLVPIDMAYDGSLTAAASQTHVVTCFAAILITAIAIMGQLYHGERRIRFLEPDALLIIFLVFASFGLIYYLG